ncbi:type II toxin-antitoxin system VapC family toxin [Planktothrix agardhii]|uniref:type II toxin-antitoxin system VapC family toxin n=1 Tax=Planktothrix agardhii TaxID=1160 RepID=UPI0020A75547|nr:PIN domain-containing protein [Planktothrix agardhii]
MTQDKMQKSFLDTNIWVYSVDTQSGDKHRASLKILRPSEREILCVSDQILSEFYSVMTSSSQVKKPLTPVETIWRIKRLIQMPNIQLLPKPSNLTNSLLVLLENHPVTGATVFDVMHVATMMSHGIRRIYTFNVDDFAWCRDMDIEVIIPE